MASLLNILDDLPPIYNHDMGIGALMPLMGGFYPARPLVPVHPHHHLKRKVAPGKVNHIGKDGFQVSMDVGEFKPSELQVKVVDRSIVIEGKHEEREDDHGHISRHFVRRYHLPKGYDVNNVMSTLSSDGVLTVSLPKPALEDKSNERVVQIQQVGPAHLNVKENPKEAIDNGSGNGEPAK